MNSKTNILYVDYSHHGGGGQVHLLNVLKHLDRSRYRPVLAAQKDSAIAAQARARKVPVFEIFMGRASWRYLWQAIPAFRALRRLMQNEKIDVVHANGLAANKLAGPAASSLGIPSIWHKHTHIEDNPHWGAEWLWKMHSLFNERVLAVSEMVGNDLQRIGVEPSKVRVLHNFVDPVPLDKAKIITAATRKRFGIPAKVPLIGTVGARRRHKGFDLFVEAAATLTNSGGIWDKAHFVMVGDQSAWEPEFEAKLVELENDQRLRGRMHTLPAQDHAASWIKSFKLLVIPSRREGFGLVALEAMVLGTPVVAAYPEAAEYMQDGKEGTMAPSGDAQALAEAMRKALKSPAAIRRRVARAKARARKEFGPEESMDALEYHYQASLNTRP